MPGAVGANPCVRPCIPGRHRDLPLQYVPKTENLFFCKTKNTPRNAIIFSENAKPLVHVSLIFSLIS